MGTRDDVSFRLWSMPLKIWIVEIVDHSDNYHPQNSVWAAYSFPITEEQAAIEPHAEWRSRVIEDHEKENARRRLHNAEHPTIPLEIKDAPNVSMAKFLKYAEMVITEMEVKSILNSRSQDDIL